MLHHHHASFPIWLLEEIGKTGGRSDANLNKHATLRPPVRRFLSAPVPLRPILFAFREL
jgi:hypothetical protein